MKLDIPIKVEVRGQCQSGFTLETINNRLEVLKRKLSRIPDYVLVERGQILNEMEFLHKLRARKFPCNAQ